MPKNRPARTRALGRELTRKLEVLKAILSRMGRVLVAYSGGVDSSLLLKVASDVLGDGVLAVVAGSSTYPSTEVRAAQRLARRLGVRQRFIHTSEIDDPRFASNPPERCYYCKKELFGRLRAVADRENIPYVLDGANADDRLDFRPGSRAGAELGVRSPLQEAKLGKAEIRTLSRYFDLSTWDKPSLACLASRFPYGTRIEAKSLRQVGAAEQVLRRLGFRQLRVRHHGPVARIEVDPSELPRVIQDATKKAIIRSLKRLGYLYVTLDLEGYRTGSLNAALGLGGRPRARVKARS